MDFQVPIQTEIPSPTEDLIADILMRRHAANRRLLAKAIRLATRVERAHAVHDACPHGLADLLLLISDDLEDHQQREEAVLFPLMLSDTTRSLAGPLSRMRRDHDGLVGLTEGLSALTDGFTPPPDACTTWRALYAVCAQLDTGLNADIALENDVLFPRFSRRPSV